jgi:hypothetical protein
MTYTVGSYLARRLQQIGLKHHSSGQQSGQSKYRHAWSAGNSGDDYKHHTFHYRSGAA